MSTAPGMLTMSNSSGSRTSTSTKSRSPRSRAWSMPWSSRTVTVEPRTAFEASPDPTPQNAS